MAPWNVIGNMPARSDTTGFAIISSGRKAKPISEETVHKMIKQWQPVSSVAIAAPGQSHFLPLVCHELYRQRVERYLRARVWMVLAIIGGFIVVSAIGLSKAPADRQNHVDFAMFVVSVLTFLHVAIDALRLYFRSDELAERASFFVWLGNMSSYRRNAYIAAAASGAVGMVQILVGATVGGNDELTERGALSYAALGDLMIVPLMTFQFLHASPSHYVFNFMNLVLIAPLLVTLVDGRIAVKCLIGGVLAGLLHCVIRQESHLVGASGAILSMCAGLAAYDKFNQQVLPPGFAVQLVSIAGVSVVGAHLLIDASATLAHVAGAAIGLLIGCTHDRRSAAALTSPP